VSNYISFIYSTSIFSPLFILFSKSYEALSPLAVL
jgi:hypothetical protein